jgi:hypothetical protein
MIKVEPEVSGKSDGVEKLAHHKRYRQINIRRDSFNLLK